MFHLISARVHYGYEHFFFCIDDSKEQECILHYWLCCRLCEFSSECCLLHHHLRISRGRFLPAPDTLSAGSVCVHVCTVASHKTHCGQEWELEHFIKFPAFLRRFQKVSIWTRYFFKNTKRGYERELAKFTLRWRLWWRTNCLCFLVSFQLPFSTLSSPVL